MTAGEGRATGDSTDPGGWHTEGGLGRPEGRGRGHWPPGGEVAQGVEGLSLSLSPPWDGMLSQSGNATERLELQGSGRRCPGVCGPSKGTLTSSMPAGPRDPPGQDLWVAQLGIPRGQRKRGPHCHTLAV